jgi:hypothetical protein
MSADMDKGLGLTMARTHLHNPSAADEAFAMLCGVNFGSGMNSFLIFSIAFGGMLSLLYSWRA